MPIIKGAKKALRASKNKKVFNDKRKKEMREVTKKISKLIADKDGKGATEVLPSAYKAIDKAAKRGIIKKNTASRKKSRLSKQIKKVS
ncbi:MAG TPA: 30S ribosomal protein S20 [Candidatus Yonathbacteria bacterium]|nr:30S ribosomal protein S20 [Candidatus Yonathbacteria bacterium]